MTPLARVARSAGPALIFLCSLPIAPVAANQIQQAANLVVVVHNVLPFAGEPDIAAGIIFGAPGNRLYILTTNHRVRRGVQVAQNLEVECRWTPGRRLPARLLNTADMTLDVAVLSVETTLPPGLLRFDLLGSPAAVQRGDAANTIGHSAEKRWVLNMQSNALSGVDGIHVYFQSRFENADASGAALLNDQAQLIGMVRNAQPPRGEALSMDTIVRWLAGNGYAVDLRPPGAPGKLSELENQIEYDVAWACGTVAAFPKQTPDAQAIVKKLSGFAARVESEPRFYGARSYIIGMLYRCLGAAYLIDQKLELDAKNRAALPHLNRSLEYYPDQPLLRQNIAFLQSSLDNNKADIRAYMKNVFQVTMGRDDPSIPGLVEAIASYMGGLEQQAQQWLMQEATNPPLGVMMDAVQTMAKKQANLDYQVELTSKRLPSGLVEVQAVIGPNIFLWHVDYARKKFTAENQLTRQFMDMMAQAQK
ncbi:MAG TPA: serine protease [Bryobacteraceae bacterium]|nr:serine protease [Bryobacteraceae bacterium]